MARDGRTQTAAVQVAIRIRPLTERDRAQPRFAKHSENDVLRAHDNSVHVVPQGKVYSFDHVFPPSTTQSEIFQTLGDKLVRKFVEGYNVTILAYGQTSSGKTYTMGTAQQTGSYRPEEEGIVPRAASLLFNLLQQQNDTRSASPVSSTSSTTANSPPSLSRAASRMRTPSRRLSPNVQRHSSAASAPNGNGQANSPHSSSSYRYTVKVSFVEIYNEELIDLLNPAPPGERPPVTIREDPQGHIYWTGVKEQPVYTAEDILTYLQQGTLNRATGATDMNEKSSRSHAILSVTLKQEKWAPSSSKSTSDSRPGSPSSLKMGSRSSNRLSVQKPAASEDGDWVITTSKFHFVDLAGSERLKRTAAEGDRRKEGININAGLLALGNVISVLGDPTKRGTHVPYRDSKLTRLLQDSLGGNATTLMIACVSPTEHNLSETLNTLQYANRARNIKNKVEKNEVEEWMTTDNIDMLRSLVGSLKNEIKTLKASKPSSSSSSSPQLGNAMNNDDYEQLYHEQRLLIADLQRQVEELDGEASVTRERNRIVEQELKRLRENPQRLDGADFQHYVEPVIEEYEKTISALESQLAMTRAALNHADIGLEEQQTKIEQYEIVMEDQESRINELQVRLSKLLKREQSNETYIRQLEQKLEYHAQNSSAEEDMLSELRGRILKFKEMDETTEKYISDLEKKLAASDQSKMELREQLRQVQAQKQEALEELQELRERVEEQETKILNLTVELDKQKKAASSDQQSSSAASSTKSETASRSRSTTATFLPPDTPSTDIIPSTTDTLLERDVLYKQINTLQHDLERALEEKKAADMEHQQEMKCLREKLARYEAAQQQTARQIQRVSDDKTLDTLAIAGGGPAVPNADESNDAHSKRAILRNMYIEESARLQRALDRTHELQSTKTSDTVSRKDAVIMRRVSDLDRQLSKQKAKVDNDLAAFDQMSASDVVSLSSKLEQEIKMLQNVTIKLEAKLHKTEMALATSAKASPPTNDEEIEELRHRMGAMMLESEEKALSLSSTNFI